jgi:hypothetical protein
MTNSILEDLPVVRLVAVIKNEQVPGPPDISISTPPSLRE